MNYLLDMNIVSEVRKSHGDSSVKAWFASVPSQSLYLSVLVLGEVRLGVERLRRRDPLRASVYEDWLGSLTNAYTDRLLPITAAVAEAWGRLNVPNPLPVVDGLMAATALVHDLTLVTRNVADFRPTGVPLLNPFDARR